ncbi:MAG: hypothetical protein M0D55_00335 [Elusimicrobiota bacterium]|nr:MAG: hypothetical protein M0D55_00335 [Elusimicrobiota bacterium]
MISLFNRNRIIHGIGTALLAAMILLVALGKYAAYVPSCDMPCPDPLACAPLALSLKVSPEKLKKGEVLWHRIEIQNQSCRILGAVQGGGFVESTDLARRDLGLWLSIVGPDGKELKRLPRHPADGGAAWNLGGEKGRVQFQSGTIHPYRFNRASYKTLLASKILDDNWFLTLKPGHSFSTIPSEVRPYRIVTAVSDLDGGSAHGYGYADVENPPFFPLPPEGFRETDRFDLSKPGRYSIRAGFNGRPSFKRLYPHWEAFPVGIKKLLHATRLAPDSQWVINELKVSIETPPVEIEVVK